MIKSKTKYSGTKEELVRFFAANHMPGIKSVEALGNGEFNVACQVCKEEKSEKYCR